MIRWLLGSAGLACATIAFACSDAPTPRPCRDIPANGCPVSNGVACEDPSCQAIYACRPNNVWELVKPCPGFDPDAGRLPDAGSSTTIIDASIDAPPGAYGGPGCEVLQDPDCPLGLALACGNGCCGCEDLYVCNAGAWDLAGQCTDAGVRTP